MARRLSGYYIRTSFFGEEFGYSAKEMLEKFKNSDCEIKKQKGYYYVFAEDAARWILDYGKTYHNVPKKYQAVVDSFRIETTKISITIGNLKNCYYSLKDSGFDDLLELISKHLDETTIEYNNIFDRYIGSLSKDLILCHQNGLMQVFDMNDFPLMAKELEDTKSV